MAFQEIQAYAERSQPMRGSPAWLASALTFVLEPSRVLLGIFLCLAPLAKDHAEFRRSQRSRRQLRVLAILHDPLRLYRKEGRICPGSRLPLQESRCLQPLKSHHPPFRPRPRHRRNLATAEL